jgi:hypothetical protein
MVISFLLSPSCSLLSLPSLLPASSFFLLPPSLPFSLPHSFLTPFCDYSKMKVTPCSPLVSPLHPYFLEVQAATNKTSLLLVSGRKEEAAQFWMEFRSLSEMQPRSLLQILQNLTKKSEFEDTKDYLDYWCLIAWKEIESQKKIA